MAGTTDDIEQVETPELDEQMGISELPKDVIGHDGCPEGTPADDDHNCQTTQKVVAEDDTLKLLLHLQCSCGHERRRVIG